MNAEISKNLGMERDYYKDPEAQELAIEKLKERGLMYFTTKHVEERMWRGYAKTTKGLIKNLTAQKDALVHNTIYDLCQLL